MVAMLWFFSLAAIFSDSEFFLIAMSNMDDEGWVRCDSAESPRSFSDLLGISVIMARCFYTPWIGQDALFQSEHPCFYPESTLLIGIQSDWVIPLILSHSLELAGYAEIFMRRLPKVYLSWKSFFAERLVNPL